MPDIESERAEHTILAWDVAPGDLLAFSGFTLHGAPGNTTAARRRRAYTVRYTGDDMRYAPRPATMPVLANPDLRAGDRLESALFPAVLRNGAPAPLPPLHPSGG
jgi:ectoine hydroxylase-related dioxygenase (phytanoyl-CoA dioxygenase family)